MGMIIVRQKVKDHAPWQPTFDQHVANHKAAGLNKPRVMRSAGYKNIVIIFDDMCTARAKKFAQLKDLNETMRKADVIDTPTIDFLESI